MMRDSIATTRFSYPGVIIAIIVVLGTWLLQIVGVFQFPDAVIYDLAVRHSPVKLDPPSVLLIAVEPEERAAGEPVWLNALEKLEALGARQIAFAFLPPNASPAFYEQAVAAGNVLFGRTVLVDQAGEAYLAPWPSAVDALPRKPPFGVVALPPVRGGAHRTQQVGYLLQDQLYPVLETRAAGQLAGDLPALSESAYLVNFQGGVGYLPMVSLRRLLQGGLVPELVKGRTVLMGVLPSAPAPGLHTPLERKNEQGMSLLMFQGYALETLLADRVIHFFSTAIVLALLALATLINVIVYQSGRLRFDLWATGGALLFYAMLAWLTPAYARYWPPVTALVFAQLATFVLVSQHRSMGNEAAIRALIINLSGRLREQIAPPGFYAAAEPWHQIVEMVRQSLDLGWLIFLERPPGQHHVREIAALNCQFADIDERRRDYRRAPYSDAIAENRLIRLRRLFLKLDPGMDQYMTPLTFGGEVLGFWAMGIAPEKIQATPGFFALVDDFVTQIAELIYHRQQWQQRQRAENSDISRYLRLRGGENLYQTLRQNLTVFERRLHGLEQVFQSLETAAIFYSPFGRVLQTNQAMVEILQHSQLPGYEMTTLDLISVLCGIDLAESRRTLQQVFVEHRDLTLSAALPGDVQHRYILHARPVLATDQVDLTGERLAEASPFQIRGILIELVDVTRLHDLGYLKNELTERVYYQLRNNLQAIMLAADLLDAQAPDSPGSLPDTLREQATEAIELVDEAQQYLLTDLLALPQLDCYPVEPRATLAAALGELTASIEERRLRVVIEGPELVSLVLADADALKETLETLAAVLIEDATMDSVLTIRLFEQTKWLTYEWVNQGFGMPDARFQSWLGSDDLTATLLFRRLRVAQRRVSGWQGELTGSSALGEGIRFTLRLRRFAGEEDDAS